VDFHHLRRSWEEFAATDPLFAIVTAPDKHGNRWDPAEFFELGRRDVEQALAGLAGHGLDPPRGRALDFGCGVGRLTRYFADHFDTVVGVDVSGRMIELAREYAPPPGGPVYVQNTRQDLALFADGSFDLVFSTLVLQHMRPDYAMGYVAEFIRLLSPGGVAMFSLPNHEPDAAPVPSPALPETAAMRARQWRARSRDLLPRVRTGAAKGVTLAREHAGAAIRRVERTLYGPVPQPLDGVAPWEPDGQDGFVATMEMYAVPVEEVVMTISAAGGAVVAADDIPFPAGYQAKMYYATRLGP
jgi:SAM-dependent methyltransferase